MNLSFRVRVVFVSLFFLAFHVPVFAMEWHEAYMKGEKAIDKGKCNEGVPLMLEALKQKPKSDLKGRPYGTFTIEYIPNFYLAKCAVESGDYEAALKYAKAAETGFVFSSSKASEFAEIKTKLQAMKKPVTPPTNVPLPKTQETNPPPKTEVPAPQIEKQELPKKDTSAEMIQSYLAEANSALNAGDLAEARNAVNRALMLDSNNAAARAILANITKREQADVEKQDLQRKLENVRSNIRSGDLNAAESQILSLRSEYPSDSSVNGLYQEIQRKKQQQQASLQQVEVNRMMEKQVLSAYYSGQYPVVIQMAEKSLKDNPNSWKLNFYLGCAYTALSMLEPEDKEDRLRRARDSFRRAKTIAGKVSLPPQISPKIVEVFRNS